MSELLPSLSLGPTKYATLRLAQREDLDALVHIERSVHPTSGWTSAALLGEFDMSLSSIWLAEVREEGIEDASAAAFLIFWSVADEIQIQNVATHTDFQRLGLGRWLVEGVTTLAQSQMFSLITLEVRVHNEAAIALYISCGFERVGHRHGYYRDGEDALIMTLDLRMEKTPEG